MSSPRSALVDMFASVNFSSLRQMEMLNTELSQQACLFGLYSLILILGLSFNAAMIWVILGRRQNRSPRNMYIANLSIAGIIMTLFCVPPTLLQILFGGWWHLGVVACKLVPVIQGSNILVSAFTITVIAIDRWRSVINTNPVDSLTFRSVFLVIAFLWILAFTVTSPLLLYQTVNRMNYPDSDIVLMQVCTEQFPSDFYRHGFTMVILIAQYIVPLVVLPIVHTKILIFLRANSGFQTDPRRRERELKRNRRMTMILSCIGIIFAVSWLPLHLYLILTDILLLLQNDRKTYYLILGLCHSVAMSSSFTNPIMYGWLNTSLRSELESLLPSFCRRNEIRNRPSSNSNDDNTAGGGQSRRNFLNPRTSIIAFNDKTNGTKTGSEVVKSDLKDPLVAVRPLEPRRDIIITSVANTKSQNNELVQDEEQQGQINLDQSTQDRKSSVTVSEFVMRKGRLIYVPVAKKISLKRKDSAKAAKSNMGHSRKQSQDIGADKNYGNTIV